MLITQGQFCKSCHGDLNTLQEKMREVCDECYYMEAEEAMEKTTL